MNKKSAAQLAYEADVQRAPLYAYAPYPARPEWDDLDPIAQSTWGHGLPVRAWDRELWMPAYREATEAHERCVNRD